MTLIDGLVSYWKLNEASGGDPDSHGSNDLTDNGSVGSDSGLFGNARKFSGSNFLSASDSPGLSGGSEKSFSFSLWAKPENANDGEVFSKWDASWWYEYRLATYLGYFYWGVMNNSWHLTSVKVHAHPNEWNHIVCWHDAENNEIGIRLNDQWVDVLPHTHGSSDGSGPLRIGASIQLPHVKYEGLIDEMGVWDRVLTPAEITEIYNSGNGLAYPFT